MEEIHNSHPYHNFECVSGKRNLIYVMQWQMLLQVVSYILWWINKCRRTWGLFYELLNSSMLTPCRTCVYCSGSLHHTHPWALICTKLIHSCRKVICWCWDSMMSLMTPIIMISHQWHRTEPCTFHDVRKTLELMSLDAHLASINPCTALSLVKTFAGAVTLT